jgi:ribosomal protein S10
MHRGALLGVVKVKVKDSKDDKWHLQTHTRLLIIAPSHSHLKILNTTWAHTATTTRN